MNKLLYLALSDITRKNIAPAIRMRSMKNGFKNLLDDQMICISGNSQQRGKAISKLLFSKNIKVFNYLYIESSNIGLSFWDFMLILSFKYRKAKISVFIRDIFPYFKSGWEFANIKGKIANILWFIALFIYKKNVDRMYFPAIAMMNYVDFKNKDTLPPGISNKIDSNTLVRSNSIFYAGGLKAAYDMIPFLNGCKMLTEEIDISVTIFCRENERDFLKDWENLDWLEIYNRSLDELDFSPMIGVVPLRNPHSNMTIALKFMDYISIGLPVIVSGSKATELIVKEEKIGLTAETGNSESYFSALKKILLNKELYKEFKENVLRMRSDSKNSWAKRCEKVLHDFGIDI